MQEQTKQKVSVAFKELLKCRSINKITMSQIAEKTRVNRQTIYYHFHDIYDILQWTMIHDLDEYLPKTEINQSNWKEGIDALILFLRENKKSVLHCYIPENRNFFEDLLKDVMHPSIECCIRSISNENNINIPESKMNLIINFYTWGIVELILEWIEQRLPDETLVHIKEIYTIIDGSAAHALKKFQNQTNIATRDF